MITRSDGPVTYRVDFRLVSPPFSSKLSWVIGAEPSTKNYSEADPRCGSHLLLSAAIGCPDIRRKLKLGMIKILQVPGLLVIFRFWSVETRAPCKFHAKGMGRAVWEQKMNGF